MNAADAGHRRLFRIPADRCCATVAADGSGARPPRPRSLAGAA